MSTIRNSLWMPESTAKRYSPTGVYMSCYAQGGALHGLPAHCNIEVAPGAAFFLTLTRRCLVLRGKRQRRRSRLSDPDAKPTQIRFS